MTIEKANAPRALEVTPDGIRWAGPTDPEPDAPIVAVTLPGPLESAAIERLVASTPIPTTLLHELALRCPPGDDNAEADPRWRRARAAADVARGAPILEVHDEPGVTIDRHINAVRVLADGTVVYIRDAQLVIGDAPPIDLPGPDSTVYALPPALTPDALPADQIVVAVRNGPLYMVLAFDATGRELARITAPFSWPDSVSLGAAGYWFHDTYGHWLVGAAPAVAERHDRWREPAVLSRRWLVSFDNAVHWRSLDTAERRSFAGPSELRKVLRVDDELWVTSPEGLWRLTGGEPPVLVWRGDAWGIAVADGQAWIGLSTSAIVVALDLATGAELWSVTAPHSVFEVRRFDNAIIASGINQLSVLDASGRVLATTDARRDVGVAQLADGTVAASCGEQIVLVDPAGAVSRPVPLPYDGRIFAATSDRFLFGPVLGGVDHVVPTATLAFDRTGRITAQLVPPTRGVAVGGDRLYAVAGTDRELRAWDPRGAAPTLTTVVPSSRRPTERGVTRRGYEVINPRDDRPEVGIEVRADFLALDGTYAGSVGQASETSFRVGNGAIATFARCDLARSSNGIVAEGASTILLIDCTLPAAHWSLKRACHLVILGGNLHGPLYIHAPPPASVTAPGLLVRRADDVHILSTTPHGRPITVDGATYLWEEDGHSGGLSYASRGRYLQYVHVTDAAGRSFSFTRPTNDSREPGWWRRPEPILEATIERAIRIARRRGAEVLTADEVAEALHGAAPTLENALVAATLNLRLLADKPNDFARADFVRAVLAAGCSGRDDAEAATAIADWLISNDELLRAARAELQRIVDETRPGEDSRANRSALVFLRDFGARVAIDLPVRLPEAGHRRGAERLPYGIPATHVWWTGRAPEEEEPTQLDRKFYS